MDLPREDHGIQPERAIDKRLQSRPPLRLRFAENLALVRTSGLGVWHIQWMVVCGVIGYLATDRKVHNSWKWDDIYYTHFGFPI